MYYYQAIVWFLVKFGCTREFFKNAQIALVVQTRAIWAFLKNSLEHVFPIIALETILTGGPDTSEKDIIQWTLMMSRHSEMDSIYRWKISIFSQI